MQISVSLPLSSKRIKGNIMKFKLSENAKKAVMLGGMCAISYLAVYIVRNILGTVTPQMIESRSFTTEQIGTLSSIYFITYAVGQLINGMIGDKIKAKYMISFGLVFAGICNLIFSFTYKTPTVAFVAYAAMGFFLSMIYGPMTRLVAENVELKYATRCSIGYMFSSFLGSPMAGILAMFLSWQMVFNVGSALLLVMGAIALTVFTSFERKGLITQKPRQKQEGKAGGIKLLIRRQIIKFTFVSILTGVVRTTVVFWMPTYFTQRLGFSTKMSAGIFTVATFLISMSAFIAITTYERLKRNMDLTLLLGFSSASVCFTLVFLVKVPVLNVVLLVLSIISSNCAASMMFSRYCPSLADTGMVSTATGFLDFMSYMAASASSTLFANAVNTIGWNKLILVWILLMLVGVAISVPAVRKQIIEKRP